MKKTTTNLEVPLAVFGLSILGIVIGIMVRDTENEFGGLFVFGALYVVAITSFIIISERLLLKAWKKK